MDTLLTDLRTAVRSLAGRPAFTLVAVLTLALGIGANTGIFSVVNALLLRPLPYAEPERLVSVTNVVPEIDMELTAGADYLEWRDGSRLLAGIAAHDGGTRFTLTGGERPERVRGAQVSAGFLPVLGVKPVRGRGFLPQEERLNAGRVAVVSHRFWERFLGSTPDLASRPVVLDGASLTVVGVLPPGFAFPGDPDLDVLVPLALDEARERGRQQMTILTVIGRLRPEATLPQVREELTALHKRSVAAAEEQRAEGGAPGPVPPPGAAPGGRGGRSFRIAVGGPPGGGPPSRGPGRGPGGGPFSLESRVEVEPLAEELVGDVRPALLLLLGAVGLVLLIACANVANLLLARATARRREMAVRAALGAGRWRIVRQLLTESALLGLAGGAAGLLLAFAGLRLLLVLVPADLWGGLLRQTPVGLDGPVLAFTLLLSLATGLLFGLAPALAAARVDLSDPLKEGGRRRPARTRGLLVAAEVAVAVVLLIGAGLLLRSFQRLLAVDPGFDPGRALTLPLDLPAGSYETPAAQTAFFLELARRMEALPGVEVAAFSDSIPLGQMAMILRGLVVDGREPLPPDRQPEVMVSAVSPGYFEALGIQIVAGHGFTEADRLGAAPVVVVSRGMARKFFGDADPLGQRIRFGPPGAPLSRVVGVVEDVHQDGLEEDARVHLYRPFLASPRPAGYLTVRTAGDPAALVASIRAVVEDLDRNVPLYDVATLEQRLATTVAARRFNLLLLGIFAALALALAGVGLYGVLAYSVTERTREIGLRMALGARREGVLRLILRQGLTLAAAGVGLGLAASFAATRVLRGSLYGVTTTDPVTYVAIPLVLLLVALLSSYLPARRATRVDPMVALRDG